MAFESSLLLLDAAIREELVKELPGKRLVFGVEGKLKKNLLVRIIELGGESLLDVLDPEKPR